MKIKTRMFLALSTLPIFFLLLIGSGWIQIKHISQSNNEIKENFNASILAGQIRADIKDEGILLRNILLADNEEAKIKDLTELENESIEIKQNILRLESIVKTDEQKALVEKLYEANNVFEIYKSRVISYVEQDKLDEAKKTINENSTILHADLSTVLREITTSFDDNLKTSLMSLIKKMQTEIIIFSIVLGLSIFAFIYILTKNILSVVKRMTTMSNVMHNISNGDLDFNTKVQVIADDEFDEIAKSFNQMTCTINKQMNIEKELTWQKSNMTDITTHLTSSRNLNMLGQTLLSKVVPLVEANHALFYVKDLKEHSQRLFSCIASYASDEKKIKRLIAPGEGLIGQAIVEQKLLVITDIPNDYLSISSGLGEATPTHLYILPIIFEGEVNAVIEIASFKPLNNRSINFLDELSNNLGIVLESVISRLQLASLLEETQTLMEEIQAQSEELQNQQEELRATNEELEEQTQALRESEQKLQDQQEILEQTNEELEDKAKRLEEQNIKYEEVNKMVEKSRAELEIKAEQLALSSKYKSEFLANMSHELRTPLNSLIILSRLLSENPNQNLTEKQVEYTKTIYSSSNDLLILINNILDLAKIESGKTEIVPGEVSIESLIEFVQSNFNVIASSKNLTFDISILEGTPSTLYSDELRIQQILKNLLSNAFKFTLEGGIKLKIGSQQQRNGKQQIMFSVSDTGIGITKDKLDLIFEAFHQADGTTSRKFGGTGLGLSISRELATLLGGKIDVESEVGKGSTFTLFVGDYTEPLSENILNEVASTTVELDPMPISTEPIVVPNKTKDQSVSSYDIKRLLIVDDDLNQRNSIMELIGNMDFIIKAVSSGQEAINLLKVEHYDCLILDLGLTDTSGFDVLTNIKNNEKHSDLKVFIYTGKELSSKEEIELNKYAHTIIIKNEHSPERLIAELSLYLKDDSNKMTTVTNTTSKDRRFKTNFDLAGKKVLLVDDDIRNVFALSSVLETAGLNVLFAENGRESLNTLEQNKDIDIILMDIMMPVMDGYEAIKQIRAKDEYKHLPIIALTAKAMKEERENCLAIGASDYIPKPVEPDQLLSIIKVWLYES